MSSNAKIGIAVVVIAALVLWWRFGMPGAGNVQIGTEQSPSGVPVSDTLPTGSSTADAALTADMSAIDAQINGFGSDNAGVNSGLTDQQVQQTSL